MNGQALTISDHEYHSNAFDGRPALSASMIRILCDESPLHAWTAHPKLNPTWRPSESTKEQDLGTLAHALMLQGIDKAHVMASVYKDRVVTDFKSNVAKEERDAARANGLIPMFEERYKEVVAMIALGRAQLLKHRDAKNAFTNGKPEQTLTWEQDGILFKVRIDWLHDDWRFIDDYKTTSISANPEVFTGRSFYANGYDIQAALYRRAVQQVVGGVAPMFRFVIQECYEPFALSVVTPDEQILALGEKKIQFASDLWKECQKSGVWPGYEPRTMIAPLTAWEEKRWTDKELLSLGIEA